MHPFFFITQTILPHSPVVHKHASVWHKHTSLSYYQYVQRLPVYYHFSISYRHKLWVMDLYMPTSIIIMYLMYIAHSHSQFSPSHRYKTLGDVSVHHHYMPTSITCTALIRIVHSFTPWVMCLHTSASILRKLSPQLCIILATVTMAATYISPHEGQWEFHICCRKSFIVCKTWNFLSTYDQRTDILPAMLWEY